MNAEELPILPIIAVTLATLYFGYEVEKRRNRLRNIFDTFDKTESRVASVLERLVESGQLTPYRAP
ncbi:hypothetical protein EP7_005103 [Isosphaeraceae bacterium EP7]